MNKHNRTTCPRAPRAWALLVIAALVAMAFATTDGFTVGAADASVEAPVSVAVIDSEAGDQAGLGLHLSFADPADANGTAPGTDGSTAWSLSGGGHTATITLSSPLGESLVVGTYESTRGGPRTADRAQLIVTVDGGSCAIASGRIVVDEIATDVDGRLVAFLARFEQTCDGGKTMLFGTIAYHATVDVPLISISPSRLEYPGLPFGMTASESFTVTNVGVTPVSIDDYWVEDPANGFAVGDTTCGDGEVVLLPAASCTVEMTFTGFGAPGPRHALMRFFYGKTALGSSMRFLRLDGETLLLGASDTDTLHGYVTADPTAVSDPDGVTVFVRGYDGSVWWRRRSNNAWSPYQRVGEGALSSLPFAVADPEGVSGLPGIHVFGRGLDGALYTGRLANGVFSGWERLGGLLTSYPTAAVTANGIDVGVRGFDGALYTRHLTSGVWGPYQQQGGYLASAPALVAHPDGRTFAFVLGGDSALYARPIGSDTWRSLGGFATSGPLATRDGDGLAVFARGYDGAAYMRRLVGTTWQPYQSLGGYTTSAVFPVTDTGGISVFVRGGDGGIYLRRYASGAWGTWQAYFGTPISTPIATAAGSVDHVFWVTPDFGLLARRFTFAPEITSASDGRSDTPPPLGDAQLAPVDLLSHR